MNRRFPIYILLAVLLTAGFSACNDKGDEPTPEQVVSFSDVAVTSFSLAKDDSVVAYLDSVYFSIDLNDGRIYNADSLPVGTDVSRLVLKIGLPSVSEAILTEPADEKGEVKTIDYLTSSKDSVDFSRGDVRLHVVSYDKQASRDYIIRVNVHTMVSDSLTWNSLAMRSLPTTLSRPTAQKTVTTGSGEIYCLASDGTDATLGVSASGDAGSWDVTGVTLPADADVTSFTAAGGRFYILGHNGLLHVSDDAVVWTATDADFHWLYGAYAGSLLASRHGAAGWEVVCYPSMKAVTVDSDFPVEGTGTLLEFETKWADTPLGLFVGGADTSGRLSADTWGFDGNEWSRISVNPLPEAMRDVALVPYFSFVTDKKTWRTTRYSALLAFDGRHADGMPDATVYISLDNGMRWSKAPALLQLPEYMPAVSGAQAIVASTLMESRSSEAAGDGWTSFPSRCLPPWMMVEAPVDLSRAVAPVSSWECPYIYLFGGVDGDGNLSNSVWRGVINRLTFKPLQ